VECMVDQSNDAIVRAGFSKVDISTSAIGAQLVGYPFGRGTAQSVRDPLYARALVMERGGKHLAICSLDVCYVNEDIVAAVHGRIMREMGIGPEDLVVCASHTHSGPFDDDRACWPDGLDSQIAEAVLKARSRMVPAQIGAGFGMVHGHSLNRRRLEDPVDPAVFVIRIDDLQRMPLGTFYGFGCHPVVLGADSPYVSGDWVSSCSEMIESHLGGDAVAVFGQGAAGDVNPLTDGVRRRFALASVVTARIHELPLVGETTYYGGGDGEGQFDIGDRMGGTFEEAENLGKAVAAEVLRVHHGIASRDVTNFWTRSVTIGEKHQTVGASAEDPWQGRGDRVRPRIGPNQPVGVTVVGIDGPDIVLVGQPGEVFSETGVDLRRQLRKAGVRYPFVVGYTNGWRAYLPPARAFHEGGYEVLWAVEMGTSDTLQEEICDAVLRTVRECRRISG
jgi:hypothetical protein